MTALRKSLINQYERAGRSKKFRNRESPGSKD
jgi:hypothetical protein